MPSFLYSETYTYYKGLIETGHLAPGSKMPSLRQCCKDRGISKTTAENAYFALIADGYIISKERSGYYVSSIKRILPENNTNTPDNKAFPDNNKNKYDLSIIGEDTSAFCFDLWFKYMKSAMRDREILSSFGEKQGEKLLRSEIASYIRNSRNIFCTENNVVIGASTQCLLGIALSLLKEKGCQTASLPTVNFSAYARSFEDNGYSVSFRNKNADIIYVSPFHMTLWGEVMSRERRFELSMHSKTGHWVIEDDYLSDFNYSGSAAPSIFSLNGGEHCIYIGSFSRVLLPSIRISFMILPDELIEIYNSIGIYFDQTASKTEQIALFRLLRDRQINKHIKKIRRLYGKKREILISILDEICRKENFYMPSCDCGTEIGVIAEKLDDRDIEKLLSKYEISCRIIRQDKDKTLLLFSCGIIDIEKLLELKEKVSDNK